MVSFELVTGVLPPREAVGPSGRNRPASVASQGLIIRVSIKRVCV